MSRRKIITAILAENFSNIDIKKLLSKMKAVRNQIQNT